VAGEDTTTVASTDPGFIGTTALVATSFSTGSYGWKGNKRITIELENPEGGNKEKVQVMLTINATVMGSKQAKEGDEENGKEDVETAEEKAEETAEEENKVAEQAPAEETVEAAD